VANITFLNITIPRDILNETLQVINKTREGPVVISNAPLLPEWLQNTLILIYLALLLLSLLLISHYIYYARHAVRESHADPPQASGGFLSIIVPVKNEDVDTVTAAVKRLAALPCPDAEVVIVSDDPPEKFEKLKEAVDALGLTNVRILRRPNPVGYKGVALNWAAERARGDVLLFLDVDSVPPLDMCARARAVGDREILFLGWDGYAAVNTPIASLQLFLYKYLLYHLAILGRFNAGHPLLALGSGIAVRKKFFEEIGGFCNCTADDYDISLRAYVHGGQVRYTPGPPVYVEVPAGYNAFKRQYARWTYNSAYVFAKYASALFSLKMPKSHKLSLFLNVATHPLMVATTFAIMAAGLAMGYAGILLPPIYVLMAQAALFALALAQVYYVYKIAKRDGYSFWTVVKRMAQSASLLLILSPYLTFYVLLGLFKRRIRWYVTPKGLSALAKGALGLYEALMAALLSMLVAIGVYLGNWVLASNSAFVLVVLAYVLLKIAK